MINQFIRAIYHKPRKKGLLEFNKVRDKLG